MSEFSVEQATEGDKLVLVFSGPIDENTQFPNPDLGGQSCLVLDFNDVTYINSIGIKGWIQWITPLAEKTAVEFRRCPKAIIFQINMVKNFLPENGKVTSFYLPLFCEACDGEDSALLEVGQDIVIEGEKANITKDLSVCKHCSDGDVEPDVIEKKYFRFLMG